MADQAFDGRGTMTVSGFAVFDTPIGRCAIAWGARGVSAVQLPGAGELATRRRMVRRAPNAREALPPREAKRAIGGIVSLLHGEATDLAFVRLDMDGLPPFNCHVYEVARAIPPGATLTYGAVSARIGAPSTPRAVGRALSRNPFAIIVPCHRVLAADGKVGGFSAHGGVTTKLRLLSIEAAHAIGATRLDLGDETAR
jgi:methylated-DNA-[protein]-cysteine S-methyltransferase